jgi:hypothetical protein
MTYRETIRNSLVCCQFLQATAMTAYGTWLPVSSICDFNHQRNILSRIATGRCERIADILEIV